MLEIVASVSVAIPLIRPVLGEACGKVYDLLWEKAAEKALGEAHGQIKRQISRPRIPINHDLAKAMRRAWLQAYAAMANDLLRRHGDEKLKAECQALQKGISREFRRWVEGAAEARWVGLGAPEIAEIYNAAGKDAAGLTGASDDVAMTRALSNFAVLDMAELLEVAPQIVPKGLEEAVRLGWQGRDGAHKLFLNVVRDYLTQDIKSESSSAHAFAIHLMQAIQTSLQASRDILNEINENSAKLLLASIGIEEAVDHLGLLLEEGFRIFGTEMAGVREELRAFHDAFSDANRSVDDKINLVRSDLRKNLILDPSVGYRLELNRSGPRTIVAERQYAASTAASWRNLMLGLYSARERLRDAHSKQCIEFLVSSSSQHVKIPLFWVEGRSGDGKSVLLLQIAEQLLERGEDLDIVQVQPDRLGNWLAWASHSAKNDPLPIALVDDISTLGNEETFRQEVRAAYSHKAFRAVVLTSGSVSQREHFAERFSSLFQVTPSSVSAPTRDDRAELAAWLEGEIDATLDVEGTRLVETTFALTHGHPETFAKTFWDSARKRELQRPLKCILALNAADIAAPINSSPSEDLAPLLRFLEAEGWEARSLTSGGNLRFLHGRLAWLVLMAACPPMEKPAKFWASALRDTIQSAADAVDVEFLVRLFRSVAGSPRWSETDDGTKKRGSLLDFLSEIVSTISGDEQTATVTIALSSLAPDTIFDAKGFVERQIDACIPRLRLTPRRLASLLVSTLAARLPVAPQNDGFVDRCVTTLLLPEVASVAAPAAVSLFRSPDTSGRLFGVISAIAKHAVKDVDAGEFYAEYLSYAPGKAVGDSFVWEWMDAFGSQSSSVIVLDRLLHHDLDRSLNMAVRWLENNGRSEAAWIILQRLWNGNTARKQLDKGAERWILRNRIVEWLGNNPSSTARCLLLVDLLPFLWGDRDVISSTISSLHVFAKTPATLSLIQAALTLPEIRLHGLDAACRWLQANPFHKDARSLLEQIRDEATDNQLVKLFRSWISFPELSDQTFTLAVDVLAHNPTNPRNLDAVKRWLQLHPRAPGAPLLLETLAQIPAATTQCAMILKDVASTVQDAQSRKDLIWSVIREPRVIRARCDEIATVISQHVSADDLSLMARHYINSVKGMPGASIILCNKLKNRHAYSKEFPFILLEMLATEPLRARMLGIAAAWLADFGHTTGSLGVARELLQHVLAVRADVLSNYRPFPPQEKQIGDALWKWCDLVGSTPMALPIVIELIDIGLPSTVEATKRAMDWLSRPDRGHTNSVWEALFDKVRRNHTARQVGAAGLEALENFAEKWIHANPHNRSTPGVLMLACGLDYRAHPVASTGYVPSVNNRHWKLRLVQAWLGSRPTKAGATFVLVTALKTKGFRRHVVSTVRDWLTEEAQGEISSNFVEMLVVESSSFRDPDSLSLLSEKERIEAVNFSEQLLSIVTDWVRENSLHSGAGYIVGVLLSEHPKSEQILTFARQWIVENFENSTLSFALMRLIQASSDDRDLRLAYKWLDDCSQDRGASFVVTTCIETVGTLEAAQVATTWVLRNPDHPGLVAVLTSLATSGLGNLQFFASQFELLERTSSGPSATPFFSAFNRWIEQRFLRSGERIDPSAKDVDGYFTDYISILKRMLPPHERDISGLRCAVGAALWAAGIGVDHDRENLLSRMDEIASDPSSARWLERNMAREAYRPVVAPLALAWLRNFPNENRSTYILISLFREPSAIEQAKELVYDLIDNCTELAGMPHVVEELLKVDLSQRTISAVQSWLRHSQKVTGWTYIAELLLEHPGDVEPILETLLASAVNTTQRRGLSDVGIPGVLLKALKRFGWTPGLTKFIDTVLEPDSPFAETVYLNLQKIASLASDRETQFVILQIFVQQLERAPPERLAHNLFRPFLADPLPYLNVLANARSATTVIGFLTPLVNTAKNDPSILSVLMTWLKEGDGRACRQTATVAVLEAAAAYPQYRGWISELMEDESREIAPHVRRGWSEIVEEIRVAEDNETGKLGSDTIAPEVKARSGHKLWLLKAIATIRTLFLGNGR